MLVEGEKNTVLFSELFIEDYSEIYNRVSSFLTQKNVCCLSVPNTADYWCRDFMPVQVSDKRYVQFMFRPDYLKGKEEYLTDTDKVMHSLRQNPLFSDIEIVKCPVVIDGGNMIVCRGYDEVGQYNLLIMTDKVMTENKGMSSTQIESEITKAVGERVKFLWLPWEGTKKDKYGHTDGMVRFINIENDGKPVVLANLDVYGSHQHDLRKCLERESYLKEISFSKYSSLNWASVNFIQTDNAIAIPGIGNPQDDEMLRVMSSLYANENIGSIPMLSFIKKWGGALNCLTWTVKL